VSPSRNEWRWAPDGSGAGICVCYGAGRGGFSLARLRPYTGPGGYFSGNPRLAPVRGPPAFIPCTGPRSLPPIFNGDPSGVWVGWGPERGQGQEMLKKTPRPRLLSGAGRVKGPGAWVFRGPVRPVTNSSGDYLKHTPLALCKGRVSPMKTRPETKTTQNWMADSAPTGPAVLDPIAGECLAPYQPHNAIICICQHHL